jgi:hypothetical protein
LGVQIIRPKPPSSSTYRQKETTQIGHIIFYEKDAFPLLGIKKETNNYPVPGTNFSTYYLLVNGIDYYDTENGSSYYDIEQI